MLILSDGSRRQASILSQGRFSIRVSGSDSGLSTGLDTGIGFWVGFRFGYQGGLPALEPGSSLGSGVRIRSQLSVGVEFKVRCWG